MSVVLHRPIVCAALALAVAAPLLGASASPRCEAPAPLKIVLKVDGGRFRPCLRWRDVARETGYIFERYRLVDGKWTEFARSNVIRKDSTSKVDKPRATDTRGTQTFKYRVRATGNVDNPWTDWVEITVKND